MYNPDTAQQYQPGTTFGDPKLGINGISLILGNGPGSGSALQTGWAPQIGHIKTNAATAKRRTNPLLAAPIESVKKKNPFIISQVQSADLFGINIPR
jgi:hypothetical protein